jgi:hypothetical protein
MHVRWTIAVCLLAVLGVIAAVLVERGGPAGEARDRQANRPLLAPGALPVDEVDRITLKRPGRPEMVFARREAYWEQAEPFAHPMQAHSIRELAALAGELVVIGTVESGEGAEALSPATVGLEPPLAEITYRWPQGSVSLKLGRRGIAGRAYLQVADDETVYVVNQDLHERAVDMDVKEWRDRRLFHDAGIDSERIEIDSSGGAIVLARDQRQWKMQSPVSSRLDDAARDELLAALGRAQSGGFILDQPDDLTRFGLADPAGSVTVVTMRRLEEGGEIVRRPDTQRLLIGARIGVGSQDRFGMVEGRPVVVRIGEPVLRALFRQPVDLVSPVASGVVAADVKTIRINGPAGDFRLQRDLERWVAPDHDDRDVPPEVVDELLSALMEARAQQVELRPWPRELEVAMITMLGFDAQPLDTVRIAQLPSADDEPGAWILENGDNVLRIHSAELSLPLTPEAFGLAVEAPE